MIQTLTRGVMMIAFLCAGMLFGGSAMATGGPGQVSIPITSGDTTETVEEGDSQSDDTGVTETVDMIVRFLSWAWIIPASLAGELMTNELVYGDGFYLGETLYKFWQFVRNIALFMLGFVFFWKIGESFVKGGDLSGLGTLILKTIVAGVLIPMSRFLVAAVVDLATVATVAVSSLPLTAMEELRSGLELDGKIPISRVVVVDDYEIQRDTNLPNNTYTLEFDDLLPQGDTVAGTLIFMGAGVMRLDQALELSRSEDDAQRTADQLSSIFIRMIMIIMLVVPMIVLVVVNIVRIVYIWLWILTMPLIIIDYVYEGPLSQRDEFKLNNIITLIFQPVVVVGTLSVGVLIILGMYGALLGQQDVADQGMAELINVSLQGDSTALIGDNTTSEVFVDAEIFGQAGDIAGGGIGRIVVSLFMIFLIRSLVKVGFSTSQLTKSISDGMYGFAESIASTVPIVPVPGLGRQSISSLDRAKDQLGRNNQFTKRINYDAQTLNRAVQTKLGLTPDTYGVEEKTSLRKQLSTSIGSNAYKRRETLKEIQKDKGIILDAETKQMIVGWIKKNANQSKKLFPGVDINKSDQDLLKLFDNGYNENNATVFRKSLNSILAASSDSIKSLEDLIKASKNYSSPTLLQRYKKS